MPSLAAISTANFMKWSLKLIPRYLSNKGRQAGDFFNAPPGTSSPPRCSTVNGCISCTPTYHNTVAKVAPFMWVNFAASKRLDDDATLSTCRVGQKSKPAYFCNNFVYCHTIFCNLCVCTVDYRKFATRWFIVSPPNILFGPPSMATLSTGWAKKVDLLIFAITFSTAVQFL